MIDLVEKEKLQDAKLRGDLVEGLSKIVAELNDQKETRSSLLYLRTALIKLETLLELNSW